MWTAVLLPHKLLLSIPITNSLRISRQIQETHHFNKLLKIQQLVLKSSSAACVKCSSSSSGASNVPQNLWKKWREKSAQMSANAAKLGLAAVLAYGLFDAVTYTTFFVLAFLGYEKSTGNNPAANIKALLGIVILMWTGNNITRPFRVAGAAALAPVIDKGLRRIQNYFKFKNLAYAFGFVVIIIAAPCLAVVGLLILSRWGK